jgi:hypothetical protein
VQKNHHTKSQFKPQTPQSHNTYSSRAYNLDGDHTKDNEIACHHIVHNLAAGSKNVFKDGQQLDSILENTTPKPFHNSK